MTDILCFWDRFSRLWIVTAHDAEGNQLWETEYFPNRRMMANAWTAIA